MYQANVAGTRLGMQLLSLPHPLLVSLVTKARALLHDAGFLARHRRTPNAFTRQRLLPLPVVMLLILQKSLKSIHRHLHEFFALWPHAARPPQTPSKGAWTQARAKLSHTASIELNAHAVLTTVDAPEHRARLRQWRGRRLLATDSSLARLPDHPDLARHFARIQAANQHGGTVACYEGRISVLYDVLNRLGRDGRLTSSAVGEVELARQHWPALDPQDVVLFARGYTGYAHLARLQQAGQDFIGRCSRGSFAAAQQLFARDEAGVSVIVTLRPSSDQRRACRAQGLPLELRIRLVTLRLSTGGLEVLVTSLLDVQAYPAEHCRLVSCNMFKRRFF